MHLSLGQLAIQATTVRKCCTGRADVLNEQHVGCFFVKNQRCLFDLVQSHSEGVTDHDEDFPSLASEVCAALPGFSICPYPVCVAHIFNRR